MVGIAIVAIAAARWAVPAADPGLEQRVAAALAVVEAVRAENAALRTELDAVGQRIETAVGQRIEAAVDKRLGAADKRLVVAEGRIAAIEKRPGRREVDASGVSDRIARLEERIASQTSAHDTITRSNLARLKELEARMANFEGSSASLPAAPAP
jgi:predicted  nucleic acid-binding Zn-ribbon protein